MKEKFAKPLKSLRIFLNMIVVKSEFVAKLDVSTLVVSFKLDLVA